MVSKGAIYTCDLPYVSENIIYGYRPIIVISNNHNNINASTVTVIALTSKQRKCPYYVDISKGVLLEDSYAICNQPRTINKDLLQHYIGDVKTIEMLEIEKKLQKYIGCL